MRPFSRHCVSASIQCLFPTIALSRLAFYITRLRAPIVKNFLIRSFCRFYTINLCDTVLSSPDEFPTFNAFFTRALKSTARPQPPAMDLLTSPVDGRISHFGTINGNRIIQAKGRYYSTVELLGGDSSLSEKFSTGNFCTIYLAPNNYHRVHMPVKGTLTEWTYVPGRLLSVNPKVARCVPRLFARNERLIAIFTTLYGTLAVIMVGALFVGSMQTVWADDVTHSHRRGRATILRHPLGVPTVYERGAEIGRFNMGSTVILLSSAGMLEWNTETIYPNARVEVGRTLTLPLKKSGNTQ